VIGPADELPPGQRARNLLDAADGPMAGGIPRAAVWATLELAAAADRQTAMLGRIADALELRRAP
jgi:hypothetical protein